MLAIRDLHVYYGGIHALNGVSLDVPDGQIISLIGANGAGKSTTLKAIMGLVAKTEGHIYWDDTDITSMKTKDIVGEGIILCPEGRKIFPDLTVEENLSAGAYLRKDKSEIAKDREWVYSLFPRLKERTWQLGATLSGGEAQRIRLATQIGAGLMGVLYILDEPSIGLHQRDNERLIKTLERLRDIGNTVIVVEHDEDTIRAADYVIDMGPGAGVNGGHVVAAGTPADIMACPDSMTGAYLTGKRMIRVPEERRKPGRGCLKITGARANNLKNVTAKIEFGTLTVVTGVSGSGKSSLVTDTIAPALTNAIHRSTRPVGPYKKIEGIECIDKVIDIDQSPIGRTPRSNPATYIGLWDDLRALFASTPESKARGYSPGRFSFNVSGGRCEACKGDGQIKIEMHFLPDIYVPCEVCGGKRYNRETLEVTYRGKTISDVLDMSVTEALAFFGNIPQIKRKLQTLYDVGLGYVSLGQPATTLSGGEAQRVKLAKELHRRQTGKTFYILDEPTTGLHFEDVRQLLDVLQRLVDAGNTVLVIEHNLDVIKVADRLIDMGPEGGNGGGTVVVSGTPEQVAACSQSYTGKFLAPLLKRDRERQAQLDAQ